jgi:tetratricopeptide (TPR) repeat protein
VPARCQLQTVTQSLSPNLDALFMQAVRCHHLGHLARAEGMYQRILAVDDRHPDALHLLGVIAAQRGCHAEAIEWIGRAIAINANPARYHANLGVSLRAMGRSSEAIQHFRRALELQPTYAEAHNNLGSALSERGELAEAEEHFCSALRANPNFADAYNNLGNLLRQTGRLDEAVTRYRLALQHTPLGHPKAAIHNSNLGIVLRDLGDLKEAEASFRRALQIQPHDASYHTGLGLVLRDRGLLDEAASSFRSAVEINPGDAEAHTNLASTLKALGRLDEAKVLCQRALQLSPTLADAHSTLATVLLELGDLEQARSCMNRALELAPDKSVYHFNAGSMKRYSPTDPHLATMEDLLQKGSALSPNEQVYLRFALGKAHDDAGNHDRGFEHWLAGNRLKRQMITYSEADTLERLRQIAKVFTADFLAAHSHSDTIAPADGPIFVVGMPRSGSTLVEQILASHSRVYGGGELNLLQPIVTDALAGAPYPGGLARRTTDFFVELGRRYSAAATTAASATRRLTDKLLRNFAYCGLIYLSLPNARIIHTRRDPMDTCLSCFSKLFVGSHPYTYDLAELGRYYRAYQHLMAHWRCVLPQGVMIDVDYEDVVRDTVGQTRRLLDHCGLAWEDSCLAFHLSKRPVRTASATQVRQPIYETSIGRWRPSEELLRPLTEALEAPSGRRLTTDVTWDHGLPG